jgi:hypothetical protein
VTPLWTDLTEVADLSDPAALARVRRAHPGADPALVSAIATQVALRRRALTRLGTWASGAILDAEALEQATRADVAAYRARRIAERWGRGRIADIGCGIGTDSHALAAAGFDVIAVEQDPWRAEAARINLAPDSVDVICGDITAGASGALNDCDVAYVDPARRSIAGPRRVDGRRTSPLNAPDEWSPPWSWVVALSGRMPVAAKLAPGFDARLAPPSADVEWIDHDGQTVETTCWMGPDGIGERRATAIVGDAIDSIWRTQEPVASGPATTTASSLLIEPTPAVVRAHLVGTLAERLGACRLDGGNWLTADACADTPLVRSWRILDEAPHGARELRAWLRGRGPVTWKTADAHVSAAEWDRRVGHRPGGGPPATVIITGQGRAFDVERPTARTPASGQCP